MLKHILFDFDGTIADSGDIGLQILNELAEKYNVRKITRDEMVLINSVPIKDRFKRIGVPFYKLPKIIMEVLPRYKALIGSIEIFDGISELIHELKSKGYILSVISSNNIENIEYVLKKYNLNQFEHIISARNIFGKHKTITNYLKKNKIGIPGFSYWTS